MVQWQLCTVEHLMNSGFGRPFPRHGLQLLFWFSNHCVTCELINFVVIMKLVSDCQPEKGFYGFHLFGNIEELLPVLERQSKRKRQVAYFEIGNLNTKTYPGAANLPTYVRENYGLDGNRGNYNIDRIIISYQVRTRVVETVYVTEHDGEASWRFSPDRTFEISCELIRALQSPQLDLTTFLIQVGYYSGHQVIQDNYIGGSHNPEPSAQQMFNTVQTYSGSTERTAQSGDLRFFSPDFNQQLGVNVEPFSYDQQRHYIVNVHNYSGLEHTYWMPETIKGSGTTSWKSYLSSGWEQFYEGFNKGVKKRSGGISLIKILLGAGALYLVAKCFSWLRSCGEGDINEKVVKRIPWRAPRYLHTHIMLDYVY